MLFFEHRGMRDKMIKKIFLLSFTTKASDSYGLLYTNNIVVTVWRFTIYTVKLALLNFIVSKGL